MDNTLTLNDGVANVVFTLKRIDDNNVVYTAPSPQGDFDGMLRIDRTAVKTKGGVLTRKFTLRVPVWDAVQGKYTGFIQRSGSLSAPSTVPSTEISKVEIMAGKLMDTVVNPDFRPEFIAGVDALGQ